MPIRVDPDEKMIRDARLTPIRVISTLYDRYVDGDAGLKARVKDAMIEKGAQYAESELAIASLRPGSSHGEIDARKLYALIKAGQITLEQFLDCVKVQKKPLEEFLPGGVIDSLAAKIRKPAPSLITEFKERVELADPDVAEAAIAELVKATVRVTAAA